MSSHSRSTVARIVLAAGLLALSAATSSCSAEREDAEPVSSSTPSSSPTSSSEPTTSATASSPATTTAATPPALTPSASPTEEVLDPSSAGEELNLADFFQPAEQWEEDRFDIANQSDVQGVGTVVDYCSDSPTYVEELELRLSNSFERLTFKVGQANNSSASDQDLTVEVVANNEQVEIRQVPFNQIQEFDIPVEAVNALKILMYLDPDNPDCGGSVIGVAHDIIVS